ncbi:MAG: histidine ammonia-lyase [Armatimonadota bacterium]|nr:histidine ammonia-lyase [Armatimonadota bacterium]MDR7550393.1 histidine ammonia-lyase [Armatimonadota bacterium]
MLEIGARVLTPEDVEAVARGGSVRLAPAARDRMARARSVVEAMVAAGRPLYGVTTGVGTLCSVAISAADAQTLQHNIVRSHAAGVGPALSESSVRAIMFLLAAALARGHSGVRPLVVETLLAMLACGVHPVIPEQGSLGASGDLAPLAHLALVLMGEGEATHRGARLPGAEALARAGLVPVILEAKEGVALINGTHLMAGLGCLFLLEAERLAAVADVAGALTLEALRGTDQAFHPRLHRLRPHPGQVASADHLRRLLAGSGRVARDAYPRIQDPYSLRCMPQVHGATRTALAHLREVLAVEINSVTDNPLVFPEDDEVISGGNFHGQPLALALDYATIATAELASISERRIERLVNPAHSGLPPFLVEGAGLHSGYMVAQYTAAALVSENKVLCHPASVDSIPTSADQEDHVSMGAAAARKALRVLAHSQQVVGVELVLAAQAIDFGEGPLGQGTAAAYHAVRSALPRLTADRVMADDLAAGAELVRSGAVLAAASAALASG